MVSLRRAVRRLGFFLDVKPSWRWYQSVQVNETLHDVLAEYVPRGRHVRSRGLAVSRAWNCRSRKHRRLTLKYTSRESSSDRETSTLLLLCVFEKLTPPRLDLPLLPSDEPAIVSELLISAATAEVETLPRVGL